MKNVDFETEDRLTGFVRSLVGKSILVICLTVMVGGHWGILQGVAWVKMTWDLSTDQTITAAIDQVLKGENPCRLCHAVASGKKAEQDLPLLKQKLKLDFEWRLKPVQVYPPCLVLPKREVLTIVKTRLPTPPIPPPRAA